MISITTKSPYALQALAELGRSGDGPVPIGELARRRDIPVQFLEQLFAVLRRAGLLKSQRGVKGGYSFARPAADITVLELVELLRAARAVGFGPAELRSVLYDLPYPTSQRPRSVEPCPLSNRELEVLKRLAKGYVYKQIAHELSLSTSTVRTHLHNIYGKLGAVDRAQAVLHATERGWL